jgi:hypothetical protein
VGASGGIITIWKSAVLVGAEMFRNSYAISVELTSIYNNESWILTNVYGPCDVDGKRSFLDWLSNVQMPDDAHWLIVGDFNLLRKPKDRNRPGVVLLK